MKTPDTSVPPHLKALLDLIAERHRPSRWQPYIPFYISLTMSCGIIAFMDDGHATTLLFAVLCSTSLFSIYERISNRRLYQMIDVLLHHHHLLCGIDTAATKAVEPTGSATTRR